MNPSSSGYTWNNPPPPGTEFDSPEEDSNITSHKNDSTRSSDRVIDHIEPYLKSPVYQGREEDYSSEKTRCKSRTKSPERRKRRRRSRSYSRSSRSQSRRSRSRSRDRYRRSRSRSRRRRRKYSSSYSRSRSHSPSYRNRRKKSSRRHSRSRSRSRTKTHRTRSRSYSRPRSYKSDKEKKQSSSPHVKEEPRESENYLDTDVGEVDMKHEEPEYEPEQEPEYDPGPIPFKNDGSFLEMFKKMQELQKVKEEPPERQPEPKKPLLPVFGKRRGGKVLKTGIVAKVRNVEEDSSNAQDAWSVYMKEVRKYKEVHCDDDSKTRPLVK